VLVHHLVLPYRNTSIKRFSQKVFAIFALLANNVDISFLGG
jgi:hypothetical protein